MADELTPLQARFVDEYLIDLNATQAAIRAGYKKNYADRMGHQLIENTRVWEQIEKRIEDRSKRTGITQDMVLKELAGIAFDDIKHYLSFKQDGNNVKVNIKDSDTIDTKNIAEISIGKDGQFKFKLYCRGHDYAPCLDEDNEQCL